MEGGKGRLEGIDSVKVVVRVRPLNSKERQEQTKSCVRITSSIDGLSSNNRTDPQGPHQIVVGKDRAFTFDEVFGIDSSQQDVYRNNVEALVDCFLEGYNATVLAYGQTGTGKTHTMSGSTVDMKGVKNEDSQGIMPRVIRAIFHKMQANQQRKEYNLRVEYIEIYNEELRDLLHPETTSKQISIREDAEGNIVMAGVKSETAQSKEAVFRLLSLGGASRVTGSTMMNEQSSRSHAIFSFIMHQRDLSSGECRKAKFHLVDLAGSERAKRTGAVAGRFKESISINQGLLALGNVISALSDEKKKLGGTDKGSASSTAVGVHVPYRDSKLTRLLQDSLGGNAKTLMIACISPATVNFEETLNTLKYANRAKNIKNRPIVNQQTQEEKQRTDDEIARMKEEIALLQSQLLVKKPPTPGTAGARSRPETSSSTQSGARRHSVAVSTSTANINQDSVVEQELHHLRKKCRAFADTIEAMRGLNVEAITSLVAMERDIKTLGRPVQQRLNEVVKMLNASVQAVGGIESSLRKSLSVVPGESSNAHLNPHDRLSVDHDTHERVAKELKEAKANLARDEQIFDMKNEEIKRLQSYVSEAKIKNEKLIQRVKELERSGQLWSNRELALFVPSQSAETCRSTEPTLECEQVQETLVSTNGHDNFDVVTSQLEVPSKRSTSSRGLFTKRSGTANGFDPQEDNVLIGNEEDPSTIKTQEMGAMLNPDSAGLHRASLEVVSVDTPMKSKIEKMLATLRGKVEELQQQNSELQHGREESIRRWQIERQQYEKELSNAEQTIESLRTANQSLEDALVEIKEHEITSFVQPHPSSNCTKQCTTEIVIDENEETTANVNHATKPTNLNIAVATSAAEVIEVYDGCVCRLIEYRRARQNIVSLMKEKKAAQINVEEASRRLNALEMQKLRQSMSLRESIVDLSQSLNQINEKMKHEHKTAEEIERLKKLKERAERKLNTLRHREAREEFLDEGTQQEVADLEELIEDLNSHIAFQDSELCSAREEMELIKRKSQLKEQSPLDSLTQTVVDKLGMSECSPILKALVKKCLEDGARMRSHEEDQVAKIKELQLTIEEREGALGQLESGLVAARKEFDRRLQLQVQESRELLNQRENQILQLTKAAQHEEIEKMRLEKLQPKTLEPEHRGVKDEEWQKLIISCQKKDEYITDLEKHVVFYKSKAKQMQNQLQQLIRDSAGNQDDDHRGDQDAHTESLQLQKRVQQLEEANDALMKDLATAKVYLRLSKTRGSSEGIHVVRVSKSELREVARPPTSVSPHDHDK